MNAIDINVQRLLTAGRLISAASHVIDKSQPSQYTFTTDLDVSAAVDGDYYVKVFIVSINE